MIRPQRTRMMIYLAENSRCSLRLLRALADLYGVTWTTLLTR